MYGRNWKVGVVAGTSASTRSLCVAKPSRERSSRVTHRLASPAPVTCWYRKPAVPLAATARLAFVALVTGRRWAPPGPAPSPPEGGGAREECPPPAAAAPAGVTGAPGRARPPVHQGE